VCLSRFAAEEFSRNGVKLVFLQSPAGTTAENQLVVQLQGMIAEYERAQIAERSRRGKRHKVQQGAVNVLSGAPYGYHYVKKSDASAGYYQVVKAEAQVVRWVFAMYTQQPLRLNAMARESTADSHPQRKGWLAAPNDMAYAAQSGLPRNGLLWQNRPTTATTEHSVSAAAKAFAASRHGEP
jgi:Resolvase, N terminal domain